MKATVLLCLLFLLCGCGEKELSMQEPEAIPVIVEPEQPVEETMVQETEPPVVEPEKTVHHLGGMDVTVNGNCLEIGSIFVNGTTCVKLEELAAALDAVWVWNDTEGGILRNGQWVQLRADVAGFRYGSHWVKLPMAPTVYDGAVYVPVKEFCRGLELGVLHDRENVRLYVESAAGAWGIPAGYRVPVIMYHGVSDEPWGMTDLFVRPAELEAQLQYLVNNGYTPIWFEDLARIDEIEKPVILTFDDGYVDNYTELYPLLQKYQVKATIFVITGTIDYNPHNLTTAQIRELSASGLVSIQSHTVTHPYLASLSPEQQQWELEQSRLTLTRITGRIPYVICYPSGNYDDTTMALSKTCYRMGIDMNGGDYWTGADPFEVSRWYIARSHPIEAFVDMVE